MAHQEIIMTFFLGLSFVIFWTFILKETTFLDFFVFRNRDWNLDLELKSPLLYSLVTCPLCFGFWFSLLAWFILKGHFFQIGAWDVLSFFVYSAYKSLCPRN